MASYTIRSGEEEPRASSLTVAIMPQQRHIKQQGDDWTGVTSTAQRRKLQNRLNQRAYRQRRDIENRKKRILAVYQDLIINGASDTNAGITAGDQAAEKDQEITTSPMTNPEGPKMLIESQHREKVLNFAREAYQHYTLGMPRPNQLHLLIRLNVLNALARNATLIGIPNDRLCADEAISPFSQSGPLPLPAQASWPESLQPTAAQMSVHHHPWIDLFPFPIMRDRAMRAFNAGLLDEDELCLDILEVNSCGAGSPFLIVWGESSDPYGWEATLAFLEKYGWLVWGCSELFESTNIWRARRGEKRLGL